MFKISLKILLGVLVFAGSYLFVDSYVARSTNYIMQVDSVNFAGNLSTSTNYSLSDTLGEMGTGLGTSTSFNLNAGYQAMQVNTYLNITSPTDATMTPAVDGVHGGVADGSAAWTVTTNSSAGYQLYVRAAAAPALHDSASHSFADYVPSYATPDFSWTTPATESRFGFSPEGADTVVKYLDNGSACGSGVGNTASACWNGFGTLNELVSSAASDNLPGGSALTLKFRAENGASHQQAQGNYSANIIISAVAN
jgi:hypothetical protein